LLTIHLELVRHDIRHARTTLKVVRFESILGGTF